MIKFIKAYYPMFISILFIFIYGFFAGVIFTDAAGLENGPFLIGFLILVICLVIAIWAEIIGFIVHVARRKHVKNPVLWAFIIYFFNIFIIPYYNLKYVIKEKKVTLAMITFGILMGLGFGIGIIGGGCVSSSGEKVLYVVSDNGEVQFEFQGNYVERKVGEYEMYASNYRKAINVGAFVYTKSDRVLAEDVQLYRESWLYNARENVKLIDNYSLEDEDKLIYSRSFSGSIDGDEFVYQISTIEFKSSGYIVNVIEVAFLEDYEKYKEEFRNILINVKEVKKPMEL